MSNSYLKLFQLHQEGIVSDYEWENHAVQAAYLFNKPGAQLFLEGHKIAFQDFVNVLKSTPTDETALDLTLGREMKPDR
jgi:hypothetical protein